MSLKEKIESLLRKTRHSQFAVTTSDSLGRAKEFAKKVGSNLCETYVIDATVTNPKTTVENLKIGKLLSEDDQGKRHKATCEVIVTTETTTTYYVLVCLSNRDVKRRIEKVAGAALRWQNVGVLGEGEQPSVPDTAIGSATESTEEALDV